jgi:hypothetical protein
LSLADGTDLRRSRLLHRLRVLRIPGFERTSGPTGGADPSATEHWTLTESDLRLPSIIEAAARGATAGDAASAALRDDVDAAGDDVGDLARLLFDTVLCGLAELSDQLADALAQGVRQARRLGSVGHALGTALGLWRHDRLLGTAGSALLGTVITAATARTLWLVEGLRGGPEPADPRRLLAVAALRDAVRHAGPVLGLAAEPTVAAGRRISADPAAPPDLRGAALGLCWALGDIVDPGPSVPRDAGTVGDWLAGLFAVARQEVLGDTDLLAVLDEIVGALSDEDFLVALPALRQAFEFFPPRERELIATAVLRLRGASGSARSLLRTGVDPLVAAQGAALEAAVTRALITSGLEVDG